MSSSLKLTRVDKMEGEEGGHTSGGTGSAKGLVGMESNRPETGQCLTRMQAPEPGRHLQGWDGEGGGGGCVVSLARTPGCDSPMGACRWAMEPRPTRTDLSSPCPFLFSLFYYLIN